MHVNTGRARRAEAFLGGYSSHTALKANYSSFTLGVLHFNSLLPSHKAMFTRSLVSFDHPDIH
jgi:hypothetical protein